MRVESRMSTLPTLGRRSERVLISLRRKLADGAYPPNSRLPTEKELCDEFEASRTTIRRAVARLAADGLVKVVQGSGTYALPRPKREEAGSCTLSVMFPFDSGSLAHVQTLAMAQDMLISVFTHTDWSPLTERNFLKRVLQERHRGLLAFCTPRQPLNDDVLAELEAVGTRVVHVEHYTMTLPERSYVLPDYREGGALAARTLLEAGYEHLRFVQIETDGPYSHIAFDGFVQALREARGEVDPESVRVVLPRGFEVHAEGQRRAEAFMAELPENAGIVARSVDDVAAALASLLRGRGRSVPDDVGIIGIKHLLNYRPCGVVDHIDYDWAALLSRAIEAVVAPNWRGIQRFVKPELVQVGSTRLRQSS